MDRAELTSRLRLDWCWLRTALRLRWPWVSRRAYDSAIQEADHNARAVLRLSARVQAMEAEVALAQTFARDGYRQAAEARKALEAAQVGTVN